jgi:hypothetical protein
MQVMILPLWSAACEKLCFFDHAAYDRSLVVEHVKSYGSWSKNGNDYLTFKFLPQAIITQSFSSRRHICQPNVA